MFAWFAPLHDPALIKWRPGLNKNHLSRQKVPIPKRGRNVLRIASTFNVNEIGGNRVVNYIANAALQMT